MRADGPWPRLPIYIMVTRLAHRDTLKQFIPVSVKSIGSNVFSQFDPKWEWTYSPLVMKCCGCRSGISPIL